MSISLEQRTKASSSNVVYAATPQALWAIHQPEKNIAIYQRPFSHLTAEVDAILDGLKDPLRMSGSPQEISIQLDEWSIESNEKSLQHWKEDVRQWIQIFAELAESNSLRVLVASINNNMCRRFHTDINDLRLLCTYSGPGTLWLPDEIINRSALNGDGDNDSIVMNEHMVQQAQTGDIVILKGAIYPAPHTKACVHRSPTIEESGLTRLLLRIDTNDFLNSLN